MAIAAMGIAISKDKRRGDVAIPSGKLWMAIVIATMIPVRRGRFLVHILNANS